MTEKHPTDKEIIPDFTLAYEEQPLTAVHDANMATVTSIHSKRGAPEETRPTSVDLADSLTRYDRSREFVEHTKRSRAANFLKKFTYPSGRKGFHVE